MRRTLFAKTGSCNTDGIVQNLLAWTDDHGAEEVMRGDVPRPTVHEAESAQVGKVEVLLEGVQHIPVQLGGEVCPSHYGECRW